MGKMLNVISKFFIVWFIYGCIYFATTNTMFGNFTDFFVPWIIGHITNTFILVLLTLYNLISRLYYMKSDRPDNLQRKDHTKFLNDIAL